MERTTVILVDDHGILRQGLRLILSSTGGIEVVAEASNGSEAIAKTAQLSPDVVILDVHMEAVDGIAVCARIRASHPATKVVMLSSDADPETVRRALQAGASAYVLKEGGSEEILRAIQTVRQNRIYLCSVVTTALFHAQMTDVNPPGKMHLTDRDRELLRCIAAGSRNKEIAAQLNLSVKSIEASRSRLMAKLGYTSPAELVRFAVREGLVSP